MSLIKKGDYKSIIVLVFEVLLGVTFMFSGYAKAVDPFGFFYKITDYLTAFGWDSFKGIALFVAILLSAAEFTLGVCMFLGVKIRWTSIGMALFMLVFTPLTLYIAIKNPVTDCGCFGDALVISNWATFYKNIVLDIMLILVYVWREHSVRQYNLKSEIGYAAVAVVFAFGLSWYGLRNLPLLDFRPYYIGANIPKGMEIPENAPRDEYKTTLIYEKDGKKQEFTLENYPKDTTWTFVDSKNELVKQGFVPAIHDFTLEDPEDGDITDVVLSDTGYTFLLVTHNLSEYTLFTNPGGAHYDYGDVVNDVYSFAKSNDYKFYCMTATSIGSDEYNAYTKATKAEYPFVNSDEIMLKTIVRSSPGLVLIKNGTIINKWSLANIPTFKEPLEKSEYKTIQEPNETERTIVSLAILLVLLLTVKFTLDKKEE